MQIYREVRNKTPDKTQAIAMSAFIEKLFLRNFIKKRIKITMLVKFTMIIILSLNINLWLSWVARKIWSSKNKLLDITFIIWVNIGSTNYNVKLYNDRRRNFFAVKSLFPLQWGIILPAVHQYGMKQKSIYPWYIKRILTITIITRTSNLKFSEVSNIHTARGGTLSL